MGLFDLFKKKEKNNLKLLKLQNSVYGKNYDKIIFPKQQILDSACNVYVPQIARMINDSVELVNNSVVPETFFFRLNFLIEKLQELITIEELIVFNPPLPSTQLDEVIEKYDLIIQQFLERYIENCVGKIKKLKTDKGKLNKINKSLENILEYKKFLKNSHLDYIENLKNNEFNINFYENKKTTDINRTNIRVPINENPSDFVDKLKRWKKNPDSEPELEQWYQNDYKKSSLYIDDISEIHSHKNTVDNNLKNLTVNKNRLINKDFNGHISENVFDLLWFADGPYKNYKEDDNSSEEINVNGFRIKVSFLGSEEPSLIYTKEPIAKPKKIDEIPNPNYYPSYVRLNPYQKWIYLNWLTNPFKEINIGYVFIFYYGLERHLLAGKFEEAFDMILKLRKIHKNSSFLHYSSYALIFSSMYKRRADKLNEFLQSLDPNEITLFLPLYLLAKYTSTKKLSVDDLIHISKSVGFTNHRYIKNERNLFKKILNTILIEMYSEPYLNIENFSLDNLPLVAVPLTSNYSLPDEKRWTKIPNLSENAQFKEVVYSLLNGTHEAVKKALRDSRKKNSKEVK